MTIGGNLRGGEMVFKYELVRPTCFFIMKIKINKIIKKRGGCKISLTKYMSAQKEHKQI